MDVGAGSGLALVQAPERLAAAPRRSSGPSTAWSTPRTCRDACPADRSATRRKGRSRHLKAIGSVLESIPSDSGRWNWNASQLGPDLCTWVTPQAPGLVLPSKSGKQERRGLGGLPQTGKAQIGRSLQVLEDYVPRPALWTVSLTDEDYEDLRELGTWQVFQRACVDGLTRLLKAHGDAALVVGVVELGLKRTRRTGRPMPHLHVVSSGWGRKRAEGGWLLCPAAMDRLVADACRAAGLPGRERPSGSKVEAIRKSVRGYLAPYLKKGSSVAEADLSDGWEALVPHQWWNRSQPMKHLVDGHLWKLPPDFSAFVEQQRLRLEGMGLGFARLVCIGRRQGKTVDKPIEVLCFHWASVEALQAGLEWFAVWSASPRAFQEMADRCPSVAGASRHAADVGLTALG